MMSRLMVFQITVKILKKFYLFRFSGNKTNGNLYIEEARKNGASIIISQEEKKKDIIKLQQKDFSSIYAQLCSAFYSKKPKNVIAVTGTNGKTSVVDFVVNYGIFMDSGQLRLEL